MYMERGFNQAGQRSMSLFNTFQRSVRIGMTVEKQFRGKIKILPVELCTCDHFPKHVSAILISILYVPALLAETIEPDNGHA